MSAYISFTVGGADFALDAGQVEEVFFCREVVRVPHAPPHLLGLVNLRGQVLPVMDLGLRLGRRAAGPVQREAIVVEVPDQAGPWRLGLLVDRLLDLQEVETQGVSPPPPLPGRVGRFVSGILAESGCYILDLGQLCASGE